MAAADPPAGVAVRSASASDHAASGASTSGPDTEGLQQPGVNGRISGDDRRVLDAHVSALRVGDAAPRLADQQRSRGDVPGREALLPETLEPACSHIREIEGGRAASANTGGMRRDPRKLQLILGKLGEVLEGEARA